MKKKNIRLLNAIALVLGIFFLVNSKTNITGAVINSSDISSTFSSILGILLMIISAVIFSTTETLEDKLAVEKVVIQKRKDDYYLIDRVTSESYSLNEIKRDAKNKDIKKLFREEFLSDLLRLYAGSKENEKFQYKQFIEALSPNTDPQNLNKRLKQFENTYSRFKDKQDYRNPDRLGDAKESDFNKEVYVRFENESETFWPEEGSIGFLPFDEVRVNKARGPLLSVIPIKRLIRDGYLLEDGETLNSGWSAQKRQDYLKNTYGVDRGSRQRNMVFFQIENGATLQPYNKYENIVIEGKVPLVKVIRKK